MVGWADYAHQLSLSYSTKYIRDYGPVSLDGSLHTVQGLKGDKMKGKSSHNSNHKEYSIQFSFIVKNSTNEVYLYWTSDMIFDCQPHIMYIQAMYVAFIKS